MNILKLGKGILRGFLKENSSYIPIVGDTISNAIENKLGTGVTTKDPSDVQAYATIGRWLAVGALVLLLAKGVLTQVQIAFIMQYLPF